MNLYWRLGIWKVHQWIDHAVGSVICWARGSHVQVWVAGSITPHPISWEPDGSGRPPPKAEQWNGVYCARCGRTLAGKPRISE